MSDYKTIDIASEEDALRDIGKTDPIYKAAGLTGDALASTETNRLLGEIVENQQKEIKHLKALRSYAAFFTVLTLVAVAVSIFQILHVFEIIDYITSAVH